MPVIIVDTIMNDRHLDEDRHEIDVAAKETQPGGINLRSIDVSCFLLHGRCLSFY